MLYQHLTLVLDLILLYVFLCFFFFQAEDGIRDGHVTGVQTCALPISSNETEGSDDVYSFVFLPNTQNNTFQIAMHETYQELAKEYGFEYTMLDPDYDLNTQLNQISDAANQGFDAAFVIPVDSAGIRQGLENLQNNNVPVFNVDTAVIEEDRDLVETIVGTDAYMAGEIMGEQLVEDYPNGAKIAILDFPENESTVQRDRKSTRLNSSHVAISYAVFCLKKINT